MKIPITTFKQTARNSRPPYHSIVNSDDQSEEEDSIGLPRLIKKAFFQRDAYIHYYNSLNTFFQIDRIGAIQDARTISVAVMCMKLKRVHGFSYWVLYETVKVLFSEPFNIRLSGLVVLSDFDSFIKTVEKVNFQYSGSSNQTETEQVIDRQKVA